MEFYILCASVIAVVGVLMIIIVKNKQQIQIINNMKQFKINEPPISVNEFSKVYYAQTTDAAKTDQEYPEGYGFAFKMLVLQTPPAVIHKSMKRFDDIHHKNIVEVYAYQTTPPILIEEYCHRFSLGEFIETKHPNLQDRMFQYGIAIDILNGIKYLHSNGITHGNLSPSNVLVTNDFQMKLSDPSFSCFSRMSDFLSKPLKPIHSCIRNVEYCSPEVKNRFIIPSSDIFSFGMIMAFVCIGRPLKNAFGRFVEIRKNQHLLINLQSKEMELIVKESTIYESYKRPPVSLLIQHITNLKLSEFSV